MYVCTLKVTESVHMTTTTSIPCHTTVKCPKYPRKERGSLEKNTRGRETLEIKISDLVSCDLRSQETEDTDSNDRREQSIGRD